MKGLVLFITLLTIVTDMKGQIPDPVQLMEKSRDLTMVSSLRSTMTLTLYEKNGSTRVRIIDMASKTIGDVEKRMIKFLEPADVRGTAMLIIDNDKAQDEMWIYLPALKRTRRIITNEKGKSFMSSEFMNADLTSSPLSDFIITHMPSSGENEIWQIQSKPVNDEKVEEYGYSRKVTFLQKDKLVLRKIDFYNFEGELARTIEVLSVQPVTGQEGYIMSEMVAKNLINGRSSRIKYDKINTSSTIPDNTFYVESLER